MQSTGSVTADWLKLVAGLAVVFALFQLLAHALGLMVDIGGSSHLEKNIVYPLGSFLYMMSCMHCTPVSLGQGGPGIGAMWGVELAYEMLSSAGFSDVQMTRLPHDIVKSLLRCAPLEAWTTCKVTWLTDL